MADQQGIYFAAKTIGLSRRGGRKACTLREAARHNTREIQAELGAVGRIDPTMSHQNIVLAGPATAAEIVELAQEIAKTAEVDMSKLRKDHVQASELVFSLPAGTDIDPSSYFAKCLSWLRGRFPGAQVLSAIVHRDEAAPHMHVLVSPISGVEYFGGLVSCSRSDLAKLRADFFKRVAGPAGLKRQSAKMRGAPKQWAVAAVLAHLKAVGDPVMQSAVWPIIAKGIEADPVPWVETLGIDPNGIKAPTETTAPKHIGFDPETGELLETPLPKHIGFAGAGFEGGRKHRNISCVGFSQKQVSDSPGGFKTEVQHPGCQ